MQTKAGSALVLFFVVLSSLNASEPGVVSHHGCLGQAEERSTPEQCNGHCGRILEILSYDEGWGSNHVFRKH